MARPRDDAGRWRDRGASVLEYTAVITLAAVVSGALLLALPDLRVTVSGSVSQAVCAILGGEDCAAAEDPVATSGSEEEPEVASNTAGDPEAGQPVLADHCTGSFAERLECEAQHEIDRATATQEILEALEATETGREALEYVDNHPIDVEFIDDPDNTCWYTGSEVQVDYTRSQEGSAGCFVHEVDHYIRDMDGEYPDPDDYDDVDDYVRAMAEYEAHARIAQIRFHRELRDEWGNSVTLHMWNDMYYDAYNDAYGQAYYDNIRTTNDHEQAREAAERAGERAGLDRLVQAYESGEPGADPAIYRDEWIRRYDDAHSCNTILGWCPPWG